MKKNIYAVVVITIIFLTLISTKSIAEEKSVSELRAQRKILQEQISENTLQLDELQGQISDLMLEIQELNDKIYKYEVEVGVLNEEIDKLNEKIAQVEKEFNETEELYNMRKELLAKRIIAQYESGDVQYLDILLNSKGIVDFISNYYTIGEIIDYDNELLKTCETQKQQISEMKQELDGYKEELKARKDEQEKSAIVLSNIRVIKNNQMSKLTEQEIGLQNQIDEYQQESQKIEIELLILLTENLGDEYVGRCFSMACTRIYIYYI